MQNLPTWATRSIAIWLMIGTLLTTLSVQGIAIPEWAPELFSQAFIDAAVNFAGDALIFFQFVRAIFLAKPEEPAAVQVLSEAKIASIKRNYQLNPFKLSRAA